MGQLGRGGVGACVCVCVCASGMLSHLGGKASLGRRTSISQHLRPLPFRIQAVFPSQQYSGQPIFPCSSSPPVTSLVSSSPGSFFAPQRARASGRPRGHRSKGRESGFPSLVVYRDSTWKPPFLWILSGAQRRMSVSNCSKSWGIKALPGVGSCFSWGTRGY